MMSIFDGGYFILSETKINHDRDIMILKDKIMSNHAFYVVMREKIYSKNGFSNKSFYKILDSSLNFEDIKYIILKLYNKNEHPAKIFECFIP